MRDVSKHPGESLAQRSDRLGCTRVGVLQLLEGAWRKGLTERDERGKWSLTLDGRKWLRPTMATRQATR
jgi:predicted transcriptional regulator